MATTPAVSLKVRADYRADNIVVQNYIDPIKAQLFAAQGAAPATNISYTNFGMVWVKATTPTTLWYTDSAGNNFAVSGSGVTLTGFTGASNTGLGVGAGTVITSGTQDTVVGVNAGAAITTGASNTALGFDALQAATTGGNNTALGANAVKALVTGSSATGVGSSALTAYTGAGPIIAVGASAGLTIGTGINDIYIGADTLTGAAEANTIRIGVPGTQLATYIPSVLVTNETSSTSATAITGAQIAGGIFAATGSPIALPLASTLDTAIPSITTGSVIKLLVIANSASPVTFTTNTGFTLTDSSMSIAAHGARVIYFQRTGANAYTVF